MSAFKKQKTKEIITIEHLPDEILTKIFRFLKFHGHLRQSLVSKRWSDIVANDVVFMRTIYFQVKQPKLQPLLDNGDTRLLRKYRLINIKSLSNVKALSALEIRLLKYTEHLYISGFVCQDTSDLMEILVHCQQLNAIHLRVPVKTSSTEIVEKIKKPIIMSIASYTCHSLDCFEHAPIKLNVRNWRLQAGNQEKLLTFVRRYASIITSMSIFENYSNVVLQELSSTDGLQLNTINFELLQSKTSKSSWEQFFKSQEQSVQICKLPKGFYGYMDHFDELCQHLISLRSLHFRIFYERSTSLDKLRGLTNLKHLYLEIACLDMYHQNNDPFKLDLDKLALEELTVKQDHIYPGQMVIQPSKEPMDSLKILKFSNIFIDKKTMKNIVEMAPNLEVLSMNHWNYWSRSNLAPLINKLIHLKSLTYDAKKRQDSDEFFKTLQLPDLTFLKIGPKITKIKSVALDCLMKNCPKLLSIMTEGSGQQKYAQFARRMPEKKFQKVHQRKIGGYQWDYDSNEESDGSNAFVF